MNLFSASKLSKKIRWKIVTTVSCVLPCLSYSNMLVELIKSLVGNETCALYRYIVISLHIRSMWETICDPTASLLGWLSLSDSFSQCDLVFCAFTDVAGSLSQSDLVFCSLSQSDLVFCAFTDVTCGWKWPIFCTGSYPLWRLIFSIRLMF